MSGTVSAEIVACIVAHKSILSGAEETATVAAGSEASAYKSIVLQFIAPNMALLVADNGTLRNGVAGEILVRHPRLNRTTISSAWGAYRVSPDRFFACTTVKAMQGLAQERKAKGAPAVKLTPAAAARAALVNAMKRAAKIGLTREIAQSELDVYWTAAPAPAPAPVETAPAAPAAPAPVNVPNPRGTRKARSAAPAQSAVSAPAPAPLAKVG